MVSDARIAAGLPSHPKTKKLIRRLGQAAAWNLVCLILWVSVNRSDGDLTGMSIEDIELAAEWDGEEGRFVETLSAVRFLDGEDCAFKLHDWVEHNPWAAGAAARNAKARWNAAKRHHGDAEADRLVPEYAATRRASSSAHEPTSALHVDATSMPSADVSNAPSPSPSPSPSPENTPQPPKGGGRGSSEFVPDGFARFWAAWPSHKRKGSKSKCLQLWCRKSLEGKADPIVAHVELCKASQDWRKQSGEFIPAPFVYLNGERWDGAKPHR